jgi:hypothetical protein
LGLLSLDLLPLRLHALSLLTGFRLLAQGALLLVVATFGLLTFGLLPLDLLPLRLHALCLLAGLGLLAHGLLLVVVATFGLLTFGLLPLRLHALCLLTGLGLLAHGLLLVVVATCGLLTLRFAARFGLLAALVDLALILLVLRGAITRVFARVRALGDAQRQGEAECG